MDCRSFVYRCLSLVAYVTESVITENLYRWWHLQELYSSPLSIAGDRTSDYSFSIGHEESRAPLNLILGMKITLCVIRSRSCVRYQFHLKLKRNKVFTQWSVCRILVSSVQRIALYVNQQSFNYNAYAIISLLQLCFYTNIPVCRDNDSDLTCTYQFRYWFAFPLCTGYGFICRL